MVGLPEVRPLAPGEQFKVMAGYRFVAWMALVSFSHCFSG